MPTLSLGDLVRDPWYKNLNTEKKVKALEAYRLQFENYIGQTKDPGILQKDLNRVNDQIDKWVDFEKYQSVKASGQDLLDKGIDITRGGKEILKSRDPGDIRSIQGQLGMIKWGDHPSFSGLSEDQRKMAHDALERELVASQINPDELTFEQAKEDLKMFRDGRGPLTLFSASEQRKQIEARRQIIKKDPRHYIRATEKLGEKSVLNLMQYIEYRPPLTEFQARQKETQKVLRAQQQFMMNPENKQFLEAMDKNPTMKERYLMVEFGDKLEKATAKAMLEEDEEEIPAQLIFNYEKLDVLPLSQIQKEIEALEVNGHSIAKQLELNAAQRRSIKSILDSYVYKRRGRGVPDDGLIKASKEQEEEAAPDVKKVTDFIKTQRKYVEEDRKKYPAGQYPHVPVVGY